MHRAILQLSQGDLSDAEPQEELKRQAIKERANQMQRELESELKHQESTGLGRSDHLALWLREDYANPNPDPKV